MTINFKLLRFFTALLFSVSAMIIGVCGMAGAFPGIEPSYFTSTITLVLGMWMKFPRMEKKSIIGEESSWTNATSAHSSPEREIL